ncbi:sensor histidine kinase [Bacillus altitudinis]|uniref:sensor histidine kinase n=1 Tax=Bacillus altitudinis TaxID=293387 RepID=UPI001C2327CC|nr:sensor histidine kinase [Bacillus altitudinis]MBU8693566.1 sensor histidine kinase [Bacillus altitudinis]MEC3814011.1 sensor histidine kinase [Bacillus altitudinis]MED4563181.1 sensor histidine kinase [Bacillus altitudinis]
MNLQKPLELLGQMRRKVVLGLVLTYMYIQMYEPLSIGELVFRTFAYLVFLLCLFPKNKLAPKKQFSMLFLMWILTHLLWIVTGHLQDSIGLTFFMIGFIAFRFSEAHHPYLFGLIFLTSGVSYYVNGLSWSMVITLPLFQLLVYTIVLISRMRRREQELKEEHFGELQLVHRELSDAHEKLKQAHIELEEATVQSLQFAVLEERSRIARDLHDSIGHQLTSMIVQLQSLPYRLKQEKPEQMAQTFDELISISKNCLTEVRSVVHHMASDDAGLGLAGLRSLVKQGEMTGELELHFYNNQLTYKKWPLTISELFYRVLQEAITNTIRHAQATTMSITLCNDDKELIMHIEDDGYVNGGSISYGFGLSGMKARCEAAGGTLKTSIRDPHGFSILVQIPIKEDTLS